MRARVAEGASTINTTKLHYTLLHCTLQDSETCELRPVRFSASISEMDPVSLALSMIWATMQLPSKPAHDCLPSHEISQLLYLPTAHGAGEASAIAVSRGSGLRAQSGSPPAVPRPKRGSVQYSGVIRTLKLHLPACSLDIHTEPQALDPNPALKLTSEFHRPSGMPLRRCSSRQAAGVQENRMEQDTQSQTPSRPSEDLDSGFARQLNKDYKTDILGFFPPLVLVVFRFS